MPKLKEPPPGPIDEEATLMRLLKTRHKPHVAKPGKDKPSRVKDTKPKKAATAKTSAPTACVSSV